VLRRIGGSGSSLTAAPRSEKTSKNGVSLDREAKGRRETIPGKGHSLRKKYQHYQGQPAPPSGEAKGKNKLEGQNSQQGLTKRSHFFTQIPQSNYRANGSADGRGNTVWNRDGLTMTKNHIVWQSHVLGLGCTREVWAECIENI